MSAPVNNIALVPPGVAPAHAHAPAPAPAPAPARRAETAQSTGVNGPSFADVLAQKTTAAAAPRFSRHALDRLQQRGIQLNQPTLGRLADGVSRAAGKGARDSVVFVDGTAFVVSVANNTVITAVGSEHMRQHVFTNIDSAVIA